MVLSSQAIEISTGEVRKGPIHLFFICGRADLSREVSIFLAFCLWVRGRARCAGFAVLGLVHLAASCSLLVLFLTVCAQYYTHSLLRVASIFFPSARGWMEAFCLFLRSDLTLHIHFRICLISPISVSFCTLVAVKFWFKMGRADLVINIAILNFLVPCTWEMRSSMYLHLL